VTTISSLAELAATVGEMRRLGVVSWNGIVLGPDPQRIAAKAKETPSDPLAAQRAYYSDVLGRPVSDDEVKRLP
jgi:hypothetical protein